MDRRQPIQTNLLLRLIDRYGVIAAIAMFLIWSLTNTFAADIRDVRRMMQDHVLEQRFYLHAICLNIAKDDAQALARCTPPPVPTPRRAEPVE